MRSEAASLLASAAAMSQVASQYAVSGDRRLIPFNWQRSKSKAAKSKAAKRKIKQAKKSKKRNRK